jgi:hypothetical protein
MARESRIAQQLQKTRSGIDVWRWTGLKRAPMPEDLWAQAAKLAERLGVGRVACDFGLCYESLKRRVEKASRKEAGAVRFVEVRRADLMWRGAMVRSSSCTRPTGHE